VIFAIEREKCSAPRKSIAMDQLNEWGNPSTMRIGSIRRLQQEYDKTPWFYRLFMKGTLLLLRSSVQKVREVVKR